jgi:hypothetical protein
LKRTDKSRPVSYNSLRFVLVKELQLEYSLKKRERRMSVSSSTKEMSTFINCRKSLGERNNNGRMKGWK